MNSRIKGRYSAEFIETAPYGYEEEQVVPILLPAGKTLFVSLPNLFHGEALGKEAEISQFYLARGHPEYFAPFRKFAIVHAQRAEKSFKVDNFYTARMGWVTVFKHLCLSGNLHTPHRLPFLFPIGVKDVINAYIYIGVGS